MQKFIAADSPCHALDFADAWALLNDKEKNYAYFMQKAQWCGLKIILHQISYESPGIFLIFQAYF